MTRPSTRTDPPTRRTSTDGNSGNHLNQQPEDGQVLVGQPERRQVLVRADTGACSKSFLRHITDAGLS